MHPRRTLAMLTAVFGSGRDPAWNPRTNTHFMAGGGGQRTFVIPTHDVVVVRLGHFRGNASGMPALNKALSNLMEALPRTR